MWQLRTKRVDSKCQQTQIPPDLLPLYILLILTNGSDCFNGFLFMYLSQWFYLRSAHLIIFYCAIWASLLDFSYALYRYRCSPTDANSLKWIYINKMQFINNFWKVKNQLTKWSGSSNQKSYNRIWNCTSKTSYPWCIHQPHFRILYVQNPPMHEERKSTVKQRIFSCVYLAYADVWRWTKGMEEPLTFWVIPTVV